MLFKCMNLDERKEVVEKVNLEAVKQNKNILTKDGYGTKISLVFGDNDSASSFVYEGDVVISVECIIK